MENQTEQPPNWKIILGAIFDFFAAFVVIGAFVALVSGNTVGYGLDLTGGPGLLLAGLIIACFVIRNPNWKVVFAAILDFLTAFVVIGYGVALATGHTAGFGFDLTGGPALLLFALIIAYFLIGNRFFRGTLWKHILGTAKPKA